MIQLKLMTVLFAVVTTAPSQSYWSTYHETPTSRIHQHVVLSPENHQSYQAHPQQVIPYSQFKLPQQQIFYYRPENHQVNQGQYQPSTNELQQHVQQDSQLELQSFNQNLQPQQQLIQSHFPQRHVIQQSPDQNYHQGFYPAFYNPSLQVYDLRQEMPWWQEWNTAVGQGQEEGEEEDEDEEDEDKVNESEDGMKKKPEKILPTLTPELDADESNKIAPNDKTTAISISPLTSSAIPESLAPIDPQLLRNVFPLRQELSGLFEQNHHPVYFVSHSNPSFKHLSVNGKLSPENPKKKHRKTTKMPSVELENEKTTASPIKETTELITEMLTESANKVTTDSADKMTTESIHETSSDSHSEDATKFDQNFMKNLLPALQQTLNIDLNMEDLDFISQQIPQKWLDERRRKEKAALTTEAPQYVKDDEAEIMEISDKHNPSIIESSTEQQIHSEVLIETNQEPVAVTKEDSESITVTASHQAPIRTQIYDQLNQYPLHLHQLGDKYQRYYIANSAPQFYGSVNPNALLLSLQQLQPIVRTDENKEKAEEKIAQVSMSSTATESSFRINVTDEDEIKEDALVVKSDQVQTRSKKAPLHDKRSVAPKEEKKASHEDKRDGSNIEGKKMSINC